MPRALAAAWLGRVGYQAAWDMQEELRRRIWAGEPAETLLLLEHSPVITLGKHARPGHVLLDDRALGARGVERVACNRGGDVTYHGPGQLIAYPVVRLDRGVIAHVQAMASAVTALAARYAIVGEFRRDQPGVWVGARKLCAFGVHVSRHVAIHGLALNVAPLAEPFSWIVPCGLRNAGVTSIGELTGDRPPVEGLVRPLAEALAREMERELVWREPPPASNQLPSKTASVK